MLQQRQGVFSWGSLRAGIHWAGKDLGARSMSVDSPCNSSRRNILIQWSTKACIYTSLRWMGQTLGRDPSPAGGQGETSADFKGARFHPFCASTLLNGPWDPPDAQSWVQEEVLLPNQRLSSSYKEKCELLWHCCIQLCSYVGQVVNVPNTKLKRNGNQNCPFAPAPPNPP